LFRLVCEMLPAAHECLTPTLLDDGFRASGSPTACHLSGARICSTRGLEALPPATRVLVLSHNRLRAFGGLPRDAELRELNLEGNELSAFPDVSHAKRLEVLRLGFNALPGVGASLAEGACGRFLRILRINDNSLRSCEGLSRLPLLVELDLSRNALRGLEGLAGGALKHLAVLRVAGNPELGSLAGLGCGRGELPALRELDASGCALRSLRGLEGALALVALDVGGNAPLASLDLGGLGGGLPSLCELRAAGCAALMALPGTLPLLFPALTLLDVAGCGLGRGGAAAASLRGVLAPARALKALVQVHVAGNPCVGALPPATAAREVAEALPGVLCVDDVWVGAGAEAEGGGGGEEEEWEEATAAAAEAPLAAAARAAASVPLQAFLPGGEAPEVVDARAAIARLRERVRGGVDGAAAAGAARWAQMGWGAPPPEPAPQRPGAAAATGAPEGGRYAHILSGGGKPAQPPRTGGSLRQALRFARLQNEAAGGLTPQNKYWAAAAAKRAAVRSPPAPGEG
jgi:hypothetical protein